jgi:thioredoxin-related protein
MNVLRRTALLALSALLALPALALAQGDGKRDAMQHFFVASMGDYPADLADARKAGKQAVFAMFMWDECPYCERMKRDVLSLPEVQKFYRERFLPLMVDTRGSVPITDFAGRQTTEKAFSTDQGVRATPTMVFYDLSGRPLYRHAGEIRDAATMIRLGQFVLSGAYKNQKFAEYTGK